MRRFYRLPEHTILVVPVYKGKDSYPSLEVALQDLEAGIKPIWMNIAFSAESDPDIWVVNLGRC